MTYVFLSCFLYEECWLLATVFDFRFDYPRRHNLIRTRTEIMNCLLLHTVSGLDEDRAGTGKLKGAVCDCS